MTQAFKLKSRPRIVNNIFADVVFFISSDLVLRAMKGVSLSGNCIPSWAKELSGNEWNNIVKRTINGEEVLPKQNQSS